MCGLYSFRKSPEETRALFGFLDEPDFPPRAHVAPGQPIAIVRMEEGQRRFALVRWGFVPSWAKELPAGKPLINARGETVMEKPTFRNAMRRRRCLVPADGYYEWSGRGSGPQDLLLRAAQGSRRSLPSADCGRPGWEPMGRRSKRPHDDHCAQPRIVRHPRPHAGDHLARGFRDLADRRSGRRSPPHPARARRDIHARSHNDREGSAAAEAEGSRISSSCSRSRSSAPCTAPGSPRSPAPRRSL